MLTLHQYHTLVNEGSLANDIEFIRGALIEKVPKSPLHEFIIAKLMGIIAPRLGAQFLLRKEGPISTRDSEPEPDVSVVKGKLQDFLMAHPTTAEFIAEVSVTSQDIDFAKADIYAEAGVPVYIILDAKERFAHVYTEPKNGQYTEVRQIKDHLTIETLGFKIDLKDIFPE